MSCLIHILIHGKLVNHMVKASQEQGLSLRTELLGVDEIDTVNDCENMKGVYNTLNPRSNNHAIS